MIGKTTRSERYDIVLKTADMFSEKLGKHITISGSDHLSLIGADIKLNLDAPTYYSDLEYALARIAYSSDVVAIDKFVDTYTRYVLEFMDDQGVLLCAEKRNIFALGVALIVNQTENCRVLSLWQKIYPGSAIAIRLENIRIFDDASEGSVEGIVPWYVAMAYGAPLKGSNPYIFEMEETLSEIQDKKFESTLILSKRLISNLIAAHFSINNPSQSSSITPETRCRAITTMINNLGKIPRKSIDRILFTRIPDHVSDTELSDSVDKVNNALRASTKSVDHTSTDNAQFQDKRASNAYHKSSYLSWPYQDINAHIHYLNVRPEDVCGLTDLPAEEYEIVHKLRSKFDEIKGKRKYDLADHGVRLHIPSYIQQRITGAAVPCFEQEIQSRGFSVLVMLDRSGSIRGDKKIWSERACRILIRALDYPFVELDVWGWNSQAANLVSIIKFDSKITSYDSKKSSPSGTTPLHLAVRIGAKHLETRNGVKYLIVVTDSVPRFKGTSGNYYPTDVLIEETSRNVLQARSKGINTIGMVTGRDVEDAQMSHMFGTNNWCRVDNHRDEMITEIVNNFTHYLKNG